MNVSGSFMNVSGQEIFWDANSSNTYII